VSVVAFDTLRFAKRLEVAGVPPEQAAATAAAFAEATGDMIATKIEVGDLRRDLAAVRAELKADIAALRQEMIAEFAAVRAEMKALELRMTIKLGTMMAATVALAAAIQKLL
jgi:hypothetical protein